MSSSSSLPTLSSSSRPVRRPDIVSVVVAAPVAGCFDYIVAEHLSVGAGSVVMVPFGNRRLPGIVLGPGSGDVVVEKLRCLGEVAALPALPAALMRFMQRFADWTLSPLGAIAKMILSQPTALAPAALQKRVFRPETMPANQRMTPARRRVLGALADGAHLTAKDLSVAADVSPAVIAGMAAQGLLGVDHVALDQPPAVPRCDLPGLTLTATQAAAAADLLAMIGQGFATTLLDGVTGSGKTEVYFEAVKTAVQAGQQVLILLPEIALSAAWRSRFAARFGVLPVE